MATSRWIRLDADWEDSPWLDALSGEAAGCWPRILCLVKRSGVKGRLRAPDHGVLARRWRVSRESVGELVDAATADGALILTDGDWLITGWSTYQDPTARERKQRERERKHPSDSHAESRNVTHVTRDTMASHVPLSRATWTETEEKEPPLVAPKKKRGSQLPEGWRPNETHARIANENHADLAREADNFRDHAAAHGRVLRDWDAGFRTWLRNARPPSQPNGLQRPKLVQTDTRPLGRVS